jgi:hypothetical protein
MPLRVDCMHRMGKTGRFKILPLLAGAALFIATGITSLAGADAPAALPLAPTVSPAKRAQVQAATAKLPLRFEQNVGQVKGADAHDVRFVSRGSAYALFLTSKEAVLAMQQPGKTAKGAQSSAVVRMRLSGANQNPAISGQDEFPGKSNYLIGKDPALWHTGVANFGRVAEQGVYPGIDLVYHGNQGQLEYDFDLAPHADPKNIRIAFDGASRLQLDPSGNLRVAVAGGDLLFKQPVAYQAGHDGSKNLVPVRYRIHGKNQVTFELASYDRLDPLVIDPILSYSTYIGGSNIDFANGIAIAPDGTAFTAGGTFSTNFPTAHALQPNDGGALDFPQDAFVLKLSADGSTLLYSTYLGGSSEDVANGIALDAAGEAFVVGTTLSRDFPITFGAFNTLCGGDGQCGATWNPQGYIVSNAFVSKLNTAGSGLIYSTFIGEYENVEGNGIAVDGAENAYVTGNAAPNFAVTVPLTAPEVPPPPFPITPSAFELTYNGQAVDAYGVCTGTCDGTNAFIAKLDAVGDGVLYSSYIGGDNETYGYALAANSSGVAYITGLTYSNAPGATSNFPLSATKLQAVNEGAGDGFLTEVNTTLSGAPSLLYSTFFGGSGLDQGNALALDSTGNVYVTGLTTSLNSTLGFTRPAGALQPQCALDSVSVCEGDAFILKVAPPAATPLLFTYLGGSLADSGTGIAVDTSDNIYVTGSTVSQDFPIEGAVFQPQYGGGNDDAFVTELNPAAAALIYSTYLGGSNTDTASGIAVDLSGNAYVAGETCSINFPLSNPEQLNPGGNCDAFVSKVIPSGGVSLSPAGLIFPDTLLSNTSSPEIITLNNGSNVALSITSITLGGADPNDFAETNTCGVSLPALGQCTISVTFSPLASGTRTAEITVVDGAGTQIASLNGTGGSTPIVTISPSTLTFPTQSVGVASTPQTITVTNTGTSPLTITSAIASGDFAVAVNNCVTALQATTPPSNCTLQINYTPSVSGTSVGSLTLTDNAPNSPQVILLTGTGALQAAVSLSPTSLTFPSQVVGSPSAPQIVTLKNTGNAPLTIGSILVTAGFGFTTTCGAPVAPGAICTISVTFTPTSLGSNTGLLTINDSAPGSPQLVTLTGGGSDFGLAVSPPSATLAAGNTAYVTVSVSSIADYNSPVIVSCAGLPALSSCSASPSSVTPSSAGPVTTTLTITTTRRSAVPPGRMPTIPGPGSTLRPWIWLLAAMVLIGFGSIAAGKRRPQWSWAVLALTALWLASFAACGAGGAGYTDPTGTPAGSYPITVTGTSSGLTHTATFTLNVQ